MNQDVYEQLKFKSRKDLFIFIYLANELTTNLYLCSNVKQFKLKRNNVLVNNYS